MARLNLRHVTCDRDPKGRPRWYVRRRGFPRKIRLPGRPGDDEFMAAYAAARGQGAARPLWRQDRGRKLPRARVARAVQMGA